MSNVYEGQPDARQSADTAHKVSRFRPTYRALTDEEKGLHDAIKTKAAELEDLFEHVRSIRSNPPAVGRYVALAMTELELSVMWAVKGLTS